MFKIYADFESFLKGVRSSGKTILPTLENIKVIFLAVLLIKLFVLMIDLGKKNYLQRRKCSL